MEVFLNPYKGEPARFIPNSNPIEIVQKITNVILQHGCLLYAVIIQSDFIKISYLDDFNMSPDDIIREAKIEVCIDQDGRF